MIQTYNDIGSQIRQFESGWNGDGQLQKIYSSARFVSMSLRSMGKTVYLYFGRGKGYEGFWVGETQVPSPLRKKDQFLEYLRKHVSGARLLGVKLDPEDRVIYVQYQKFGRECSLGLFYLGRKLYFANNYYDQKSARMKLFKSWTKGEFFDEEIEKSFLEVGKAAQDTSLASKAIADISELLEVEEKEGLGQKKLLKKEGRFLSRKAKNIEMDLKKASKWVDLRDWLEKETNLEESPKKTVVAGIKLNFSEKTHFKRRDEVYAKIKKLKKGQRIQEERLGEALKAIEGKANTGDVSSSSLDVIKPIWGKDKAEKSEVKVVEESGYKIFSETGFEMGVGMSAKGNDQLRKLWAKKDDWWFHTEAGASAHIIAKVSVVTPEILQAVADKMKKSSQLSGEEINLIYTQVKNLKGIAGSPGAVNYKKEKRVRVYLQNA